MSSSEGSQSKPNSNSKTKSKPKPKSKPKSKEVSSSHKSHKRKSRDEVSATTHGSTKFIITPISNRGSRQKVSLSNMELALAWTNEFDYDDFVGSWKNNDKMPIFYRLINTFLLLLRYRDSQDKQYFALDVEATIEEGLIQDFEIDTDSIVQQLLKNIVELYSTISLFPKASKFLDKKGAKFLYHGFKNTDSIIVKKLRGLSVGTVFEMPIFLSTSVVIDVACRFSGEAQIILRIMVPEDKLQNLTYAFFGDTIVVREKNSVFENEILLNLFTKLKFIKITTREELSFEVPQIDKTLLTKCGNFFIIDMEFVSNSHYEPDNVMSNLVEQIKQFKQIRKEKNKPHSGSTSRGGQIKQIRSRKLYTRKYIRQH